MRRAAGPALAFALTLLAGCAARPVGLEMPADAATIDAAAREAWRQHRATVAEIDGWNLKGKIAAQTGRRGGSATLLWERRRGFSTLQLHGPFGGGRIRITAAPGRAELVDARGRVTTGADAAEVLRRRTNWRVPFAQLTRWVRGLPGDGAVGVVVDARGRVKRFTEGDWRVEFQDYATAGGVDLPRRLTVTGLAGAAGLNDGGDGGASRRPRSPHPRHPRSSLSGGGGDGDRLTVRLVVNSWRELDFGAR